MENNNNEEIEIDLREIFGVLLSKAYIIVAVSIAFAFIAGLVTKLCITPQYQSTSGLYVLTKGGDSVSSALTSLTDLQLGSQVLLDYEELKNIVTIKNNDNTRILYITVTHPDPKIAKEIVDEIASVSSKYSADIMDVKAPNIFVDGEVAKTQTSPNTKKNVAIAAIIGFLLTCVIIVVRYLLDDTIQSQEDVEKYLGLNTLGLIPIEEGSMERLKKDKKKRKKDMR